MMKQIVDELNKDNLLEIKPGTIRCVNVSEAEYVSSDELYLLKARTVVELNIDDIEFGVSEFAKEMETSLSTLHRRIFALLNLSAQQYIQQIRLKHAERMLKQKIGSVTDIAHAVGFNDPKYFSKCFKRHYGSKPSEILRDKAD